MLKVYNSLGRRRQVFKPLRGKEVKLYTCGPTVYARPHLGNYRTYVFEDVARRYLQYLGYTVKHVMNVTDYDDTILKEVRKTGVPRKRMTARYERLFSQDMRLLGVLPADEYPHVSDYTAEMADIAAALLAKGFAYRDERGRMFFRLSRFPGYGKLNGGRVRKRGRVTMEDYKPWQAGDFLVWLPCRRKGGDCFDSKLGKAQPPWNIQCAAMSLHTHGKKIDIAMGGRDNLFNHHENTRAVVGALYGTEYSKYWMHVRHLMMGGRKMSKSRHNTVLLPDMMRRKFSPQEVRFILLSAHYRRRLNFTWGYAKRMKGKHLRLKHGIAALKRAREEGSEKFAAIAAKAVSSFEADMDDDFDVPGAAAVVERFLRECLGLALSKKQSADALALLGKFNAVLGFLPL